VVADPIATRLKTFRAPAAIAVAFIFSRGLIYSVGVTFYSSFVHRMWQILDVSQLSEHLIDSLWYMHSQPPLFNALVGVLVKTFPEHYYKVFLLINLIGSLSSAFLIYATLRKVKVSDLMAGLLAMLMVLNPVIMLYENLFSYTVLTIFLLGLTLYFLVVFLVERSPFAWISFCVMLAVIVLTRSSYHVAWMVVIVLIAIGYSPREMRRRLLLVALLPIIVASSWYVKNYAVFGTFSSSSWLGMNMARIFPPATPLGAIRPFRPLQEYNGFYGPARRYPDIPVLADRQKRSGYVNYNHEDYLVISQLFRDDVMRSIAANPWQPIGRVPEALTIFFTPATHAPFIDINLQRIQPYAAAATLDFSDYHKYQAIRPTRDVDPTAAFMRANGFTTTAALPVALLYIAVLALVGLTWLKGKFASTDRCLLLVLLFILAYGMLVGNLLEFGENNRFRLELSPVFFVLSGIALDRALLLFQKIKP
jgi:hypothetical protein